jgi:glycosyltransferase involved in cell wall biosynthesis
MTNPLISTIIPAYNYGRYLPETLDCLVAQTYKNWECIIVNDGSTDNTEEVAKKYAKNDRRFKYFYQKNQGTSAAKNEGIKRSSGEYIQFLDSDDLILPSKFENQIKLFLKNKGIDVVYGNARYFFNNDISKLTYSIHGDNNEWIPRMNGRGKDVIKYLASQESIMPISSPLIRKEAIVKAGGFNNNLKYHEDADLFVRLGFNNNYFFYDSSETPLTLIRVHPLSATSKKSNMVQGNLYVRNKIQKYLQQNYKKDKYLISANKNIIVYLYFQLGDIFKSEGKIFKSNVVKLKGAILSREIKRIFYVFTLFILPEDSSRRSFAKKVYNSFKFINP